MSEHYKSIKDASAEWGISPRRVQILCTEGRISGAYKDGRIWKIPASAVKPDDNRIKDPESNNTHHFSEMRKASYNFLDCYSNEVQAELNNIINYCYIIKDDPSNVDRIVKYVTDMRQSASSVLEYTAELSKLINLEGNIHDIHEVVVDLPKTVDHFLKILSVKFEEMGYEFTYSSKIYSKYAYAELDLHRLFFRGLFSSLIKHTTSNKIDLVIKEVPKIDDNTCSLKYIITCESDISQLSPRQRYINTSFLYNMMNYINGKYDVDDKKLINSSNEAFKSFTFNYRVANESAFNPDVESSWINFNVEKDETFFKGKRILLADTNDSIKESERECLKTIGVEVEVVDSGIQVLSELEKHFSDHYDIVLYNIDMPSMDGLAVAKTIRKFPNTYKAHIPVIAIVNEGNFMTPEMKAAGINAVIYRNRELKSQLYLLKQEIIKAKKGNNQ